MNPTAAAPVADAQRHDVLDALRGLALFGVLLVNLRDFSLYSLLPEAGRAAYAAFYARPRHGARGQHRLRPAHAHRQRTVIAAVALFALQTWLSSWWLQRFRFGPAEWVWRSLTYGRRQPLRRGAPVTLAGGAA